VVFKFVSQWSICLLKTIYGPLSVSFVKTYQLLAEVIFLILKKHDTMAAFHEIIFIENDFVAIV